MRDNTDCLVACENSHTFMCAARTALFSQANGLAEIQFQINVLQDIKRRDPKFIFIKSFQTFILKREICRYFYYLNSLLSGTVSHEYSNKWAFSTIKDDLLFSDYALEF